MKSNILNDYQVVKSMFLEVLLYLSCSFKHPHLLTSGPSLYSEGIYTSLLEGWCECGSPAGALFPAG